MVNNAKHSFQPNPEKVYYMFYKPTGVVTAKSDIRHETIMKYLKDIETPALHPLGRLDKDTDGLLLLTDDGKFTNALMSPKQHVPKTYQFCILGVLNDKQIKEIESGICWSEEDLITAPCHIHIDKVSALSDILPLIVNTPFRRLVKNHPDSPVSFGTITITEGRKHHVKKTMKYAHCTIITLKRIAIGGLFLDEALQPGAYRMLTEEDFLRI